MSGGSTPAHLRDLAHDPKNARKHNPRNVQQLVDSLQRNGAARSIVIDENNRILAGNATVEAAAQAGIENVRIIEADGMEIIAVRRSGLTEAQKIDVAISDNRVAELATWDLDMLATLSTEVDLHPHWTEGELDPLLSMSQTEREAPEGFAEYDDDIHTDYRCPQCAYEWSGKPK